MKHEETNDVSTILIEATDERAAVIKQVSKQTKPVVIVLPEQADQIFKQPGDFFELKRLKRERGLSITLVISGHERIRNMARRQGFQVYTSAETCARALARRDRLYTLRGISLSGTTTSLVDQTRFIAQGDDTDDYSPPWSYDIRLQQPASTTETPETMWMQSQESSSNNTPWSYDIQMSQDETPTDAHPRRTIWMLAEEELWNQNHRQSTQHDQHTTPAYLERAPFADARNQPESFNFASLKETPIPPSFTETLENLVALSGTPPSYLERASFARTHNSGPFDTSSPRLVELSDEMPTHPMATIRTQATRYAPNTEPLYPARETQPLMHNEHAGSRIALMLTALLILGILGGIGCSYVLTLMHVNLTVLNYTINSL